MRRNQNKQLIYLSLLILPFLIFFFRPRFAQNLKSNVSSVLSVPLRILSIPGQELKKILSYRKIHRHNRQLMAEVSRMKSRLIGYEDLLRENAELAQMLDFKRKLLFSSKAAYVIGRDPDQWNSSVIIDKGQRDGLAVGMAVVNASGVVGKLVEVFANKSKVMLITDAQFSVAARVHRNRGAVLVSGSIDGQCRIKYNQGIDLRVGDQLVTSKLSVSFPENILVGTITKIRERDGSFSDEVWVKPEVDVSQLEEVLVIIQ